MPHTQIVLEPLALSLEDAAQAVGLRVHEFHGQFIVTGRIRPIQLGPCSAIDVGDLRDAWRAVLEERGDR